ncbi:MAG TPA: two-component regulator propeller domain-containing protein [Candidatus Eisenbacteria bacterium]|nr:two-component regulator propeller domain-containing protein [Candidatus Eisenbacteria bacterium]
MAIAATVAAVAVAGAAGAVSTSYWEIRDTDDLFAGEEAVGVTIDSEGSLSLGASWDSLVTKVDGASYIWAAARDSKGRLWLGTGDEGRIYRWAPGSGLSLVWDTDASEITSIAIDAADNVYAGSSPGGVIYRVGAKGDTTRYYDTAEGSVWSLLVGKDGVLYAGTGSAGKIFKITAPKAGALLAETKDANVMVLAEAPDGAILAGTAGKGLLLKVAKNGGARVLYDADADELRAIAVLPDGSIAIGTNRTQSARSGGSGGGGARGGNPYAIDVTPQGPGKCGIFLVQPDGSARALYSPPCEFVYALRPAGPKSVLAATGQPAAIFRIDTDRKFALLAAPREKQVLAIAGSGDALYAATGNPAALFALGPGKAKEGRYISDAHDLRSVAGWGRFAARVAGSGDVLLSTRSGFGETPDEGWSAWSPDVPLRSGEAPISSPPARFLQYRLRFRGEGASLSTIDLSYVPRNLAPELGAIRLYGPDQPFMEGGPEYRPPQISQTFPNGLKVEYSYPRSGPRAVSDPSAAWARGIRTVAWEGLDPNGDDVVYDVFIKPADETTWRNLAEEIPERLVSWDAESYPNGDYRVKVIASDKRGNPPGSELTTERLSSPFRIDNVPPRVETLHASARSTKMAGAKPSILVTGTATDADTRISSIEYSIDGGDWTSVFPKDGLYDQKEEAFEFVIPDVARGEHSVAVRASDQDRNVSVGKVLSTAP